MKFNLTDWLCEPTPLQKAVLGFIITCIMATVLYLMIGVSVDFSEEWTNLFGRFVKTIILSSLFVQTICYFIDWYGRKN